MVLHGVVFRGRASLARARWRHIADGSRGPPAARPSVDLVHRGQVANGFAESAERLVMIQIADVLADEGLAIHHQSDGILQVGTHGQNRPFAAGRRATAPGA